MKVINSTQDPILDTLYETHKSIPYGLIVEGSWTPPTKDFRIPWTDGLIDQMADVPQNGYCYLDIEGSLDPDHTDVNLDLAHPNANPATSATIRRDFLEAARAARPDVHFGVYGIPFSAKNFNTEWEEMTRRDALCSDHISGLVDFMHIDCYPVTAPNQEEWRKRIRIQYGLALSYYPDIPIHAGYYRGSGDDEVTIDRMMEDALWLRQLGFDGYIYWDKAAVTSVGQDTKDALAVINGWNAVP